MSIIATVSSSTYYSVIPVTTAEIKPHSEGQAQFNEMVYPKDVEKEDNYTLIEKGLDFASALYAKLTSLDLTDEHLQELVKKIESFDLQSPLLLDPSLPYFIMEALRRGFLDQEHGQHQAATILNFWAALQYHQSPTNLQTIPMFEGDAVNPLAESLIKQTLGTFDPLDRTVVTSPFLEGAKFDLFMENMRKLPASERQFLLAPDIQVTRGGNPFVESVSQAIKKNSSINLFSRVQHNGRAMRIIPSIGMMQAFLNAQYDEPVQIKPRLYLSTEMQIQDCGETSRDMMMSFPDHSGASKCPPTADGFPAPWYDFSYHDFYHAVTASAIPMKYRKATLIASDALLELAESCCGGKKGHGKSFYELAVNLIDMEYLQFQHFVNTQAQNPHSEKFWLTMNAEVAQYRNSPIPMEDKLAFIKCLFNTFVVQKKGPSELSEASFKAAVESRRESLNLDRLIEKSRKDSKKKFGFDPGGPSNHQLESLRETIRLELENDPLLLADKELGFLTILSLHLVQIGKTLGF